MDLGTPPTGSDKVAHVVLFAVPVGAAVLAFRRPWLTVCALAVHAPLSEWLQSRLLPGRSGDVGDVVADLLGVALGVVAGVLVMRRQGGRAPADTLVR